MKNKEKKSLEEALYDLSHALDEKPRRVSEETELPTSGEDIADEFTDLDDFDVDSTEETVDKVEESEIEMDDEIIEEEDTVEEKELDAKEDKIEEKNKEEDDEEETTGGKRALVLFIVLLIIFTSIGIMFIFNKKDDDTKVGSKKSNTNAEKTYTASFNGNGIEIEVDALKCNTKSTSCTIIAPAVEIDGMLGWSTSPDGTDIIKVGDQITLTSDTTYYVIVDQAEEQTFTVKLEANGSSVAEGVKTLSCTTRGVACTVDMPSFSRNSWRVLGWSDSTTGEIVTTAAGKITLNATNNGKTYYAITEQTLTATFTANNATISKTTASCTTRTNTCSVASPTISRSGYTTFGWAVNANEPIVYGSGSQIPLTGNTNYVAISERTFTATFSGEGATTASASCNARGNSCVITMPNINRTGWTVNGWATSANERTNFIAPRAEQTISGNTTYHAITSRTLTATFALNGATSVSTGSRSCTIWNTATSCNVTGRAPTITRNNFTITGWNTNATATTSILDVNGNIPALTADITYYAITTRTVTATFTQNGATSIGYNSRSCTIDNANTSCAVQAPTVTATNRVVFGWSTAANQYTFILAGGNITLTANTEYLARFGFSAVFNSTDRVTSMDLPTTNAAQCTATPTAITCICFAATTNSATCAITTPRIVSTSNVWSRSATGNSNNVNGNTNLTLSYTLNSLNRPDHTYYGR